VLALVLGGAVAGLVLLLTQPAPKPAPPWSSWKPVGSDPDIVTQQIAQAKERSGPGDLAKLLAGGDTWTV